MASLHPADYRGQNIVTGDLRRQETDEATMIKKIDYDDINQGHLYSEPLIITNGLRDWRIHERWTPAQLNEILKDKPVQARVCTGRSFGHDIPDMENGGEDYIPQPKFTMEAMTFGSFTERVTDKDSEGYLYLQQRSVPDEFPELIEQVSTPGIIKNHNPIINLWYGRDSITPLHFDMSNNMFAQLYGAKVFTLFDPEDTNRLYPCAPWSVSPQMSLVNIDRPNLDKHPEFAKARPIKFKLEQGQILYLPSYWWHQVEAEGVSISVSFWWFAQISQFIRCSNSTRALDNMYKSDRLAGLSDYLKSNESSMADISFLLLNNGRIGDASILAMATLDSYLANTFEEYRAKRSLGCSLKDLQRDLSDGYLVASAAKSISDAHKQILSKAPCLAERAADFQDDRIGAQEVVDLLNAVTALDKARD